MPKRETRDFRIDGLDNLVAHMTQHDAGTAAPKADPKAGPSAPQVRSGDEGSPAEDAGSRAAEVRLVVADDSESVTNRPVLEQVSEAPLPTEDVSATPPRKPSARKKKNSRSRKTPLSKGDSRGETLSGAEWRAARTKSTMRLSPEVQRKIQVRSATEALEQQIVVEIALRQFFGMEPLSADMKRDARAQAVWAAMSAESVA